MRLLYLAAFIFIVCSASSQSPAVIKVKAGDDPLPSFPRGERYLYKEFTDGYVFDMQGKPTPMAKMNFQLISGNLEAIQQNGDTLVIDNSNDRYKNVQILSDFFQHEQTGYYRMLTRGGSVKLASKLRWMMVRRERAGDTWVSGPNTEASSWRDPKTGLMIKAEYFVYSKVMTYYLTDGKGNVDYADRSTFSKMFPAHKKEIRAFINETAIDFLNQKDLKKLLTYCSSLK